MPISLICFSGFYFVPPFGTCSSIASFCLACRFYFSVSGRLVMFPDLGEMTFVGDVLCVLAVHSPLITIDICSRGAPYVGSLGPSVVAG